MSNYNPIVVLLKHVFTKRAYIDEFKIKNDILDNFLQRVNNTYVRENMYHNATHGADVTNSVLFLIENVLSKVEEFSELEFFALIFAAMVHDLGHKGVNNAFLIGVQDPLALIYNDQSVLENMHISKTFDILQEYNVIEFMNENEFKIFRKNLIRLVLDTDLQKHFVIMKNFEKNVVANEDFQDEEKRIFTLSMCLKSSDVGHGAKKTDLHKIWSRRITLEFYNQGELEIARNLPISPVCNKNGDLPKGQIWFLEKLVMPMYKALYETINDDQITVNCINQVEDNRKFWENECIKKENGQPCFDVNENLELQL